MTDSLFYGALVTLLAYEAGLMIKRRFRLALFNPILVASLIVICLNSFTGTPYPHYESSARYLSWLLTPATVCLAVPLYEQLRLLKKHPAAVLCGLGAGVVAGLGSVWLFSCLFRLDHQMYATLLPKSVTSAIGMGIAEELGGLPTLAVSVIILCGILGHVLAEGFLRLIRVTHPIAKGLAIGTASHAIGTAKAMDMGPVEGAMSSLAIAAAGLLTVVLAPLFAGLI